MPMNHTGFFHHIGTFLLFAATIFLIITDISAPVADEIALLKVKLGSNANGDEVSFGTFGYCIINSGVNNPNDCTNSQIGYSPADVMNQVSGVKYNDYTVSTTAGLTKVMVLHPVATGLCFIAFVMALGAGVMGSLLASIVSAIAFIVTLVVLVTDFVAFALIKNNINDQSNDGTYAYFSVAMWTILVSAICSLLGTLVVFFTCCSGRLHKKRAHTKGETYVSPPATRRRRFAMPWSRGARRTRV